jgi:geranylgeranyl diphosphate synthase type II
VLYPFQSGGKRFRPKLCFYSSLLFNIPEADAYRVGAAIEILHTASLIHDDLPEIDNDDYRRGRMATHKRFTAGLAVVCADELFFLSAKALTPFENTKLLDIFLQTAMDLAKGEAYDIFYEKQRQPLSLEQLLMIYRLKTASLIKFAIVAPGIMKGIAQQKLATLYGCGEKIGLAFQIYDDIKDETGTFDTLGKTPQKDTKTGKQTILRIFPPERAIRYAEDLWKESMEGIEKVIPKSGANPLASFLVDAKEQIRNH